MHQPLVRSFSSSNEMPHGQNEQDLLLVPRLHLKKNIMKSRIMDAREIKYRLRFSTTSQQLWIFGDLLKLIQCLFLKPYFQSPQPLTRLRGEFERVTHAGPPPAYRCAPRGPD